MPSDGIDALRAQQASGRRVHRTPPPPHVKKSSANLTSVPPPEIPDLPDLVNGGVAGQPKPAPARSSATTSKDVDKGQASTPPDPVEEVPSVRHAAPILTVRRGASPEYQAVKAATDAALAWAAVSRKLAVREDALARTLRTARQAGASSEELLAVVAAAEAKAGAQLDRASLAKFLA